MSHAYLRIPAYYQDGMVLQQKAVTKIYGRTKPGAEVTLTLERFPADGRDFSPLDTEYGTIYEDNDYAEDDGFFEIKLPLCDASFDPYTLTLQSVGETIVVRELLFGEVWLLAGADAMSMTLAQAEQQDEIERLATIDSIRICTMHEYGLEPGEKEYSYEPLARIAGAAWLRGGSVTQMEQASAIGFSFAREVSLELQLPVGLYQTACSGTYLHSWLPREIVEADVLIKNHIREKLHYRDKDSWNSLVVERRRESPASRISALSMQLPRREERLGIRKVSINQTFADPEQGPTGFKRMNQPAAMFNHKLAPFTGLALRGILWSQGELDADSPEYYSRAFRLLTETWQQMFVAPGGGLNLIYTLLPASYHASFDFKQLALFNESLAGVRRQLPIRAGLVSLHDLSLAYAEPLDASAGITTEPLAKQPVGRRMKEIAMGLAYFRDQPSSSPECIAMERVGSMMMLSFENVGSGLRLNGDETALKGFAICGPDRVFTEARARVHYGVRVLIWHEEIEMPESCTYGFANFNQEANLISANGLPVVPFRLDLEASAYWKPLPWTACDQLEAFAYPVDPHSQTSLQDPLDWPGLKPLWTVKSGRGQLTLERDNKRFSTHALNLEYKNAADRPIHFGPVLDYASTYPPLDLSNWRNLKIDLFNADHKPKKLSLYMADVNQREVLFQPLEIEDVLRWQELIFDFSDAALDLQRISTIELILTDPDDRGSLVIDRLELQGLRSNT